MKQEFKVGDTVKFIQKHQPSVYLTPEKEYTVLEVSKIDTVRVIDDTGIGHFYDSGRFQLVDRRKIIGYKSPMDLYGESVKKGTIYVKDEPEDVFYIIKGTKRTFGQTMPKEVVETWEPVYEEKDVIIEVGKENPRRVKVFKDKVEVSDVNHNIYTIMKEEIVGMQKLLSATSYKLRCGLEIKASAWVGCTQGTSVSIADIVNILDAMDKL